tara:strand:- start:948 stop:1490 length:543 start_codon:yes stop_codon:yes gene_type:complete
MADLIIKPSAGSGNKLILQNQAGNAILTTGNSATDSIFPSGHVINVIWHQTNPAHTITSSGTTTIATKTFTPNASTNNLLIETIATGQLYGNTNTTNPNVEVEVHHNGTLIDTVWDVHNNNIGSNSAHNFVQTVTKDLIAVDHASASGARAVEIKLKWVAGRWYTEANGYGHRITIWEIA